MEERAQGLRDVGHRDGGVSPLLAALLYLVPDRGHLRRHVLSLPGRRRLDPLLDRVLQLNPEPRHIRHDKQGLQGRFHGHLEEDLLLVLPQQRLRRRRGRIRN